MLSTVPNSQKDIDRLSEQIKVWYRAHDGMDEETTTIQKVAVLRFTKDYVTLAMEGRRPRVSLAGRDAYFPKWIDAWRWLLERKRNLMVACQRSLDHATAELKYIMAMENPEENPDETD